jgi:hypothetical protein
LRGVSCEKPSLKPPTWASKRREEGCGGLTGVAPLVFFPKAIQGSYPREKRRRRRRNSFVGSRPITRRRRSNGHLDFRRAFTR